MSEIITLLQYMLMELIRQQDLYLWDCIDILARGSLDPVDIAALSERKVQRFCSSFILNKALEMFLSGTVAQDTDRSPV